MIVTLKGLPDDSREIAKLIGSLQKRLRKASLVGVHRTAHRIVAHIKSEVINNQSPIPFDKGFYSAGWRVWEHELGADIYNIAPYAAVIEHGARGENVKISREMIDNLAAWVRRKGLVSNMTARIHARGLSAIFEDEPKEENSEADSVKIAFAIAKAMQKKGIFNGGKGLRILEKGLDELQKFATEEINDAFNRLTEAELEKLAKAKPEPKSKSEKLKESAHGVIARAEKKIGKFIKRYSKKLADRNKKRLIDWGYK